MRHEQGPDEVALPSTVPVLEALHRSVSSHGTLDCPQGCDNHAALAAGGHFRSQPAKHKPHGLTSSSKNSAAGATCPHGVTQQGAPPPRERRPCGEAQSCGHRTVAAHRQRALATGTLAVIGPTRQAWPRSWGRGSRAPERRYGARAWPGRPLSPRPRPRATGGDGGLWLHHCRPPGHVHDDCPHWEMLGPAQRTPPTVPRALWGRGRRAAPHGPTDPENRFSWQAPGRSGEPDRCGELRDTGQPPPGREPGRTPARSRSPRASGVAGG